MTDWSRSTVLAGALVGLGVAAAGVAVGSRLPQVLGPSVVTVRGLSERDVMADLATWVIATQSNGSELSSVQRDADRDANLVRAFLTGHGFAASDIQNRGSSVQQYFDSSRGQMNITIRQRFLLRSPDVERMQRAFADQAEMIRQGVAFDSEGGDVTYSFTGLNDVKPEMIAEATRSAREAAAQFAEDSGTKVGGIRKATQGYFSLTGRDGDVGSGTDTPFQKLRVVTTVEFRLD